MRTRAREIVGMDADRVISVLRAALADEWLAYFQYRVGAKVVKGPMKNAVTAELMQHAADEIRHADMVARRIMALGWAPVTKPADWYRFAKCDYRAPDDPHVETVLAQSIKGEQCAITTYSDLLKKTKDTDPVTYGMVGQILQDEVTHEEDLQNLAEDIQRTIKHNR